MASNENQHNLVRGVEGRRPPRRKVVDLSFEQHMSIGEWIYKSIASIIFVMVAMLTLLFALLFVQFSIELEPVEVLVKVEMQADAIQDVPQESEDKSTPEDDLPDFREQIKNDIRNLQSNASSSESGAKSESIFDDPEIVSMMQQQGATETTTVDMGGISESTTLGSGGWGSGSGGSSGAGAGMGTGKGDSDFSGRVTVTYEFKEPVRSARGQLYVPAYRTEHSGTVVVTVKINRNGEVKSAYVSKSSGIDALDKEALRAAKHSRTIFNIDSSASAEQSGTITYVFIAQ